MGKLDDIEKKIYRKDDRGKLDAERKHNTPYSVYGKKSNKSAHYEEYEEADPLFLSKHRKKIIRGAIFGLALLGLGGLVSLALYINAGRFSPDRVDLVIEGPEEVTAGDEVDYTVRYSNNNRTSLKNASLSISLPDNMSQTSFKILGDTRESVKNFDLPELKPDESGEVTFSGRLSGEMGTSHQIETSLSYVPGTLSSTFDKENQFNSVITDNPLVVDIENPLKTTSGNFTQYSIIVNNRGRTDLEDIHLQIDYPSQFTFSEASQEAITSDNNQFKIGRINSQSNYELTIGGTLQGDPGDLGVIKVQAGPEKNNEFIKYTSTQDSTTLSEPLVLVEQTTESPIARPGENITYTIKAENNTEVVLRDGELTVDISDTLFDKSSISSLNVDYDGTNLIWDADDLSQLEIFRPNETAQVSFTLPLVDSIPVTDFSDTEFRAQTQARFTSNNVPAQLGMNRIVQGNDYSVKLSSDITGDSTYTHQDGPNPPEPGKTTTYTIQLSAQTLTNDISKATFSAQLQPNVTWANTTNTNGNGNLNYQPNTREVRWKVDNIPANTGKLRPAYKAEFEVEVTPSSDQSGQKMPILTPTSYSGTDVFTGVDIQGSIPKIEIPVAEPSQADESQSD